MRMIHDSGGWHSPHRRTALGFAVLLAVGCGGETAPPRGQIVVFVDTDAPVVAQLKDDPTLSGDAVVDTLRIDAVDDAGNVTDLLTVVAPGPDDWPVSFGIATEDAVGHRVRLRLRGFRGQLSIRGEVDGTATLEPPAQATIDRVADVTLPEDKQYVRITLRGACLGIAPKFGPDPKTCVDAARPNASPSEDVAVVGESPGPSLVGTWPEARAVPCRMPGDTERICIPGGISVLGDLNLRGSDDGIFVRVSPAPLRPVLLSPFKMDRMEMTVGRFRTILARNPGALTGDELPLPKGAGATKYCTFLGEGDPANDAFPLTCISFDSARKVCALEGGDLPSEARWEHAARGRGQRRKYPWGDDPPTCCRSSIGRSNPTSSLSPTCPGDGLEPAGSHVGDGCAGGDVSRDGVVDLGGSARELTLDELAGYDEPCWLGAGLLHDPVCDSDATAHVSRGGSWYEGPLASASARRFTQIGQINSTGFRCVYPDM
jgi:formylglycine-generating enzyme required for sulfatase activity